MHCGLSNDCPLPRHEGLVLVSGGRRFLSSSYIRVIPRRASIPIPNHQCSCIAECDSNSVSGVK